ncbi:MAG: protein-L-isoaspartate(D-aspartate) O-methyltransferase, partial [Steroidobacteraceae bacterium]
FSARVMGAMDAVPRHRFVPARSVGSAYANRPLPIGHGQTISQPYIVALMTELLEPQPDDVMLEIGTGSGYQAAVLAKLVARVYTIEIIAPLAESAAARLRELGYQNVQVKIGDGYYGWPEHGPFDGIIVTAAAGSIPPPLIAQLKPGGRMVIPVGAPFHTQDLILLQKDPQGRVTTTSILPVAFVPLTGRR